MKRSVIYILLVFTGFRAFAGGGDSACKRLEQLSYVFAELKGFDGAKKYIDSMDNCGNNPTAVYSKAMLLYKDNKYAKALRLFEQYIEQPETENNQVAAAYNYAGICVYKTGDYEKSLEYYQKAQENGFGKATVYYNTGITYTAMNDYDAAIDAYKTSLKYDKNWGNTWNNLGVQYENKMAVDVALSYYATAYTLSKGKDPLLSFNYGASLRKNNKIDSALLIQQEVIKNFPDYYKADAEIAKIYNFHLKTPQKGIVYARRAVAAAPSFSSGYFQLAYSQSDLGYKDSALYNYSLVLLLEPNEDAAYTNSANIYKLYGYFEKSIEYNLKALEIKPNSMYAIANLHNTYLYMYDFENSFKYALMEYEVHTNFPEKALALGYAYLQAGQYRNAIPYLQEASIDRKSHYDVPLNNLGLTYIRLGNLDSGKYYLDKAFAINPNNSFIYHNRALYYFKIGDFEKACADLKTSIDLEYNWIIDPLLEGMVKEHCKDVNVNRVINYHGYKGYFPEFSDKNFIQLIDSLSLNHFESELKPIADELKVDIANREEKPAQTSMFSVYPNPTKGNITISHTNDDTEKYNLDVYNSNGQKVFTALVNSPQTQINLTAFSKGLYVAVILQNNNVVHTEKVILE